MQIVIDIPKDEYNKICSGKFNVDGYFKMNLKEAFRNAISLPKGHGRLIDADDLYKNTEICHSDIDGYACVRWKDINDAPTIIERSEET